MRMCAVEVEVVKRAAQEKSLATDSEEVTTHRSNYDLQD